MGQGFGEAWIHVHERLSLFTVQLKLSPHCYSAILQYKIKSFILKINSPLTPRHLFIHSFIHSSSDSPNCQNASEESSFPGDSVVKNLHANAEESRRCRSDSWVGKIPWRKKRQSTPVFLPEKLPWAEEPGGLQSIRSKRVGHN